MSCDGGYEGQKRGRRRSPCIHGPKGRAAGGAPLLLEKGTSSGKPFEKRLWFSDPYVRTPGGWRYVFGQASIPLPQ